MIEVQADAQENQAVGRVPRSGRRRTLWRQLLAWTVTVAVLGFNVWWYRRDTRALPTLATIGRWMAQQRYAEAEPALREHLRRRPHDGEARTMLARLLAARNDSLGCARALHQVPDWWPTKAEMTFREGQTYLLIDRARDAEAAWRTIVADKPLHLAPPAIFLDATVELLKLYATEDRWEDAPPIIWAAYDRASPEDRSLLLVMRMRSELERVAPSESIGRLQRYVAADPQDVEARRALARAELALGRTDDAAREFRTCLKDRPDDARAWRDYLAMLLERGDIDMFQTMLARVPASAETEPQIWVFRAIAREKQGDLAAAVRLYGEALARNPFITEFHYRCALVEDRLGHREEAARHRTRAQQLRAARSELLEVFADYLDLSNHRPTRSTRDRPTCIKRLAAICETLGWTRVSDAWIEELSRTQTAEGG